MQIEVVELSYSELSTLCRRVMFSLATPAGVDTELAESLVWLESMNHPILHELAVLYPKQKYDSENSKCTYNNMPDGSVVIETGCDSGFYSLPSVVDQIAVIHKKTEKFKVKIFKLKYPALLLRLLMKRSAMNDQLVLSIGSLLAEIANGEIKMNCQLSDFADCVGDMPCVIQRKPANNPTASMPSSTKDLNSVQPNPQRIILPQRLYRQLRSIALESMVPPTSLSRQSGAGAGEIDND